MSLSTFSCFIYHKLQKLGCPAWQGLTSARYAKFADPESPGFSPNELQAVEVGWWRWVKVKEDYRYIGWFWGPKNLDGSQPETQPRKCHKIRSYKFHSLSLSYMISGDFIFMAIKSSDIRTFHISNVTVTCYLILVIWFINMFCHSRFLATVRLQVLVAMQQQLDIGWTNGEWGSPWMEKALNQMEVSMETHLHMGYFPATCLIVNFLCCSACPKLFPMCWAEFLN